MKVVDASALVEVLLGSAKGERVTDRIDDDECAAPELLCVEVLSTLARLVRAGDLDASDADLATESMSGTEIEMLGQRDLISMAWALRDRVRITDGFYVACAKLLDAPLITCDGRLARAPLSGVSIMHVQ